ncbi:YflT domain-containing protein [Naumannella cuiyingiana]|uniref:Putative membrane protein n=1 Tax=Naumannella cuiyingiana TaxID=1347891 RepID=A0A7Z0DAL8_9ACTN|nr:general stress protein [Naumannella cuiyingiana]NYI71963.1 putative membrane protein [Naumannella cuiyingiana]
MSLNQPRQLGSLFELEFPQSVGIYDKYEQAQEAVDFLADEKFPVQNLAIVGTELKSVERVLSRKSWGSVIQQGIISGIGTGLLVGLVMMIFGEPAQLLAILLTALGIGIVIGLVFAVIGYAMSGGKRDFNSVSQIVATKYEVLSEHKVAQQARDLLNSRPGARAAQFE